MSVLNEKLPESLERVRLFLANHPKTNGWDVHIYAWPDVEHYGIRVAEVSLSKAMSGGAFMQSDIGGGTVCFYAERLALCYQDEGSDDETANDIEDAELNLIEAMFGVTPAASAPPRVVVTFKDGLVADVYADRPVKVAVIDYDPAQDDEITYIPAQGLGDKPAADEPALASVNDAAVLPDSIEDVFAAINRQLVK